MSEHDVDGADEYRHPAEGDELWQESWYADVVTPDGSAAAYIRLGLYPNLSAAWWHVALVGPDRPVVVCQRTDVPVPDEGLVVTADDLDIALSIERELESFTVRGTMVGARHGAAGDVYGGGPGEPVPVNVDLTWVTDGRPFHYRMTTRYEIPCTVTGSITVAGETVRLDGPGQRDHSWGVRDWWSFGWCWSAGHLDDGTHTHLTEVRADGGPFHAGYLQRDGELTPIAAGGVTEDHGDHGFPRLATARHGDLEVQIEPIAYGPILLTSPDGRIGCFPRASARFATPDGRKGLGWVEWNQPPGS